jgi:hypothetical protein
MSNVSSRQALCKTRSKTTLVQNEQDVFQNNEQLSRIQNVSVFNRENCAIKAQYVQQEHDRRTEAVPNQGYVVQESDYADYNDKELGENFNCETIVESEPGCENEVHVQMKKVLTEMKDAETKNLPRKM